MRYGSVCSGIEAATMGWHGLGWEPAFFSEIDAFPRAVLAHHYPEVPLHGDFTTICADQYGPIDLLVGGTPCQSFSVAGLRGGLDDNRGNLALEYLRLADRTRPRWLVWENVPGVLSSNGGRDFGSILGGMVELGYGVAYRVLDAQHFGVPQRRRRVFLIGYLGDWRRAAAVLFERHSLQGHPAPRREAGKAVAGTLGGSSQSGGFRTTDLDNSGAFIPMTRIDCTPEGIAGSMSSKWHKGTGGPDGDEHYNLVAHPPAIAFSAKDHGGDAEYELSPTLRAGGFTGSHANGGVMPAVAFDLRGREGGAQFEGPHDTANIRAASGVSSRSYVMGDQNADAAEAGPSEALRALRGALGEEAFAQWGLGVLASFLPPEVLRAGLHVGGVRCPARSRDWLVHCALCREVDLPSGAMLSVREAAGEGCPSQGPQLSEQCARELGAYLSVLSQPGASAARVMHDLLRADEGSRLLRETLSALEEMGRSARGEGQPAHASAVRRLTATECEFLQGFPRNFTLIPWRGGMASDGPRYKALGNSMAVPCMLWLGQRIAAVEALA